jgi:hypothetical protein
MSSGPKMLFVLSLGLLPLGIIAIIASIYSARENSAQRAEQTLGRLEDKAERLNELLARSMGTMRAASAAVAAAPADSPICERVLTRLAGLQMEPGRYALYGPDGTLRCATPAFAPQLGSRRVPSGQALEISPDGSTLRLILFTERRTVEAIAEYSREALRDLTFIPGTRADFNLELTGGGRRMPLRDDYRPMFFSQTVSDVAPIANNALQLRIRLGAVPIRAVDVLLILLPVMMWIAAGVIGWWIVNRQLLKPLGTIQRIVSSYRPGDRPLELPSLKSPAREIGELGSAFDNVTRTVARHEAELEAAVERQTRLVREVHHRVKNNLQVVAFAAEPAFARQQERGRRRRLCLDPAPGRRSRGRPSQPLCRTRGESRRRAQAARLRTGRQSARHRPAKRIGDADPRRHRPLLRDPGRGGVGRLPGDRNHRVRDAVRRAPGLDRARARRT